MAGRYRLESAKNELTALQQLQQATKLPGTAPLIRTFSTGATRDQDSTKLDFEGFLSPISIERYGEYMNRHRIQPDGSIRDSDNWQKGIPQDAYVKSLVRHTHDVHLEHRGFASREDLENDLCGVIFNAMGLLHEILKARGYKQRPASAKVLIGGAFGRD